MSDKDECPPPKPPLTGELPKQSEKEVHVPYWKTPPPLPPDQDIYPRQKIPDPPQGDEIADDDPSPPVELE